MNRFPHVSLITSAALVLVLTSCSNSSSRKPEAASAGSDSDAKIVRLDPAFDKLVPANARVEKLDDGHKWVEGPVWNRKDGFLLFSDTKTNIIFKWQEGKGASRFIEPSGYTGETPFTGAEPGSNGLTYDSEGRLVACDHGNRRVYRLEADGKTKTTLADKYDGKRFNSPNDLVYKSNGDLYFTDPIYGLPQGEKDPGRELDFCGVYRLSKDGKVTLLTKDITRPNGIAFSPDEKKLYVSSSDPDKAIWMVYEVQPDGTIANGRVFYDATDLVKQNSPGLPDGMKIDKDGNLFGAGPGGVQVFSAEGKHIGTFDTGGKISNVGWGGDGSTLYITADSALLRVKLNTSGEGF